jgi:hypothetical protein
MAIAPESPIWSPGFRPLKAIIEHFVARKSFRDIFTNRRIRVGVYCFFGQPLRDMIKFQDPSPDIDSHEKR